MLSCVVIGPSPCDIIRSAENLLIKIQMENFQNYYQSKSFVIVYSLLSA